MEMRIIIPTRGRVDRQITVKSLKGLHEHVTIVCPEREVERHRLNWPMVGVVAQPDPDFTITAKRRWIMENSPEERILMLDDDLEFQVRREDKPDRLRSASGPEEVKKWLSELEKRLTPDCPHGGFGPRQGNHTQPAGWVGPARQMFALGYHLPTVLSEGIELGRIETREDMDVALQLLRRGLPNTITHEFVVSAAGYADKGGCSGQRTTESSNNDAKRLAELHPGYVRVVEKTYKNHPRLEVVCSWKKALQHGTQWRADRAA